MSLVRRGFLVLTVALAFSASQAMAGGHGGTKKNGKINVVNNSGFTVLFTDNANSAAIIAATQAGSLAQFQAAGGIVLTPGQGTSLSVKAGTYSLAAVDETNQFTPGAPVNTNTIATATVVVGAGQSKNVSIVANPNVPVGSTTAPDISILDP